MGPHPGGPGGREAPREAGGGVYNYFPYIDASMHPIILLKSPIYITSEINKMCKPRIYEKSYQRRAPQKLLQKLIFAFQNRLFPVRAVASHF